MSIGNTNFITLDSIAEIQDIVNGDYLFTVSNGVIYKLDFQNLILTPDNVDFYTTIESLSAQVVSLTNAFSAVNSQMNTLSSLDGVGSLVHAMSADWTNVFTQVQNLSAASWLPIDSSAVQSGSLATYVGGSNSWEALVPGLEGDSLQILNNVPQFTGTNSGYDIIYDQSATYQVNDTVETSYVDVIPLISTTTGGKDYGFLGVTWNVTFNGGQGNDTNNKSVLLIEYGDGRSSQIITGESYAINEGTNLSYPISFTVIPQASFGSVREYGSKPLGSFSALGSSQSDYERPFKDDPIIISNVLGAKFNKFINNIPDAGGVPSRWNYDFSEGTRQRNTIVNPTLIKLWDNATTFLKVYGRSSN